MGLHLSRGAAFHIHQNVIGTVLDRTRTNGQPTVNRQSTDSQGSRHSKIRSFFNPSYTVYILCIYTLSFIIIFICTCHFFFVPLHPQRF